MGAGSSTLSSGNVPSSRKVGKFLLTPDLQKQTYILSKLFEKLLQKNNLLDLADLVKTPGAGETRCDNIIAVLASQINKEFQTLRFPDRTSPQQSLILTSFVNKEQYEKFMKSGVLNDVCTRIAEFLFRFVLLVSALTMSISLPDVDVPVLADAAGKDFFAPSVQIPAGKSVPQAIWEILKGTVGSQQIVERGSAEGGLLLLGNKYFLREFGYLYQNVASSPIFTVEFEFWGWLDGRKFSSTSDEDYYQQKKTEFMTRWNQWKEGFNASVARLQASGIPLAQAQAQVIASEPKFSLSTSSSGYGSGPLTGGRRLRGKSRKGVRNSGKRRGMTRRHGGEGPNNNVGSPSALPVTPVVPATPAVPAVTAAPVPPIVPPSGPANAPRIPSLEEILGSKINKKFFKIKLTGKTTTSGDVVKEYVFNQASQVFSKAYFDGSPQKEDLTPDIAGILPMLDEYVFKDVGNMVQTDMIRRRLGESTGQQIFMTPETQVWLKGLYQMNERGEKGVLDQIHSPAAFRAFLLASQIPVYEPQTIQTSLCKDSWSLAPLNSVPAYALLESLYGFQKRELGTGMVPAEGDTVALSDKQEFLNRMLGDQFVIAGASEKKDPSMFQSFVFPDNKDAKRRPSLAAKCTTAATGKAEALSYSTNDAKSILTGAYNALRQLYVQHVTQVFEFLKTILVVDELFLSGIQVSDLDYPKPVIRLNPYFVQHVAGSQTALNEKIRRARNMLAGHYYQVEKIYNDALNRLNQLN